MVSSLEYYEVPFWVSFMALFLKYVFSHVSIATPVFFPVHLLGKFVSSPSLSVCVSLLSWGGSLVGSICVGHVLLSIQLFYVFWLEHLIHLHLRLLSIGSYSLPFFHACVPLSFLFPSFPEIIPFSISCRAGLVELYSFRLLLSGKLFIWPSILIESLAG